MTHSSYIDSCGLRAYRVTGSSMTPTLRDGDVVFVRRVNSESLKPGDVLVARREETTVLVHRYMGAIFDGVGNHWFVEKGDNDRRCGLVANQAIMGRVEAAWLAPTGPVLPASRLAWPITVRFHVITGKLWLWARSGVCTVRKRGIRPRNALRRISGVVCLCVLRALGGLERRFHRI